MAGKALRSWSLHRSGRVVAYRFWGCTSVKRSSSTSASFPFDTWWSWADVLLNSWVMSSKTLSNGDLSSFIHVFSSCLSCCSHLMIWAFRMTPGSISLFEGSNAGSMGNLLVSCFFIALYNDRQSLASKLRSSGIPRDLFTRLAIG